MTLHLIDVQAHVPLFGVTLGVQHVEADLHVLVVAVLLHNIQADSVSWLAHLLIAGVTLLLLVDNTVSLQIHIWQLWCRVISVGHFRSNSFSSLYARLNT